MTTIAYAGNGHIAADSRRCSGDLISPVAVDKILLVQHNGKRYLVGMSGTPGFIAELVKHHLLREARQIAGIDRLFVASNPDTANASSAIVVHLDEEAGHRVYHLDPNGLADDITGVPWAVGSGREYAMGAMAANADAQQAVAIAARFDAWTGGPIRSVSIEAMKRAPASNFKPLHASGA